MTRALVCVIAVLAALAPLSAESDNTGAPSALLTIKPSASVKLPAFARSAHQVDVDFKLLSSFEKGGEYTVTLLNGLEFRFCVTKRTERTPDDYSLVGFFKGEKYSLFSVVVRNQRVSALAIIPDRKLTYKLEHNTSGDLMLYDINGSAFPPCGVSTLTDNPGIEEESVPVVCNDKPDKIDVLVVYTQFARYAVGSDDAIQAECQLAVDLANSCYENSKINTSLRLVAACEVYYDEHGEFADHLYRLENKADGCMDEVHQLRDQYAADVVCLIVDSMEYCGIARIMTRLKPEFASQAFSVVSRACASANLSLAHEIGHNQGCAHNREDATDQRLYPYSYGWRFTGVDGNRYRTVMAYNNETWDFVRIPYFSNPEVTYQEIATGVLPGQPNEANNALTIMNSAQTVASFRQSDFWLDFDACNSGNSGCQGAPFNTLKQALEKLPARARLFIHEGKSTEKLTISQPVELIPVGGDVRLGAPD